jgi:putative flippase GtrA
VTSTVAYVALYLLLRLGMPAQGANAVALLLTGIANTAANRRFTFAVRGRRHALRHQAQGLGALAASLVVTAGALAAVRGADPRPARAVEVLALVAANLVATVVRFVLLRSWVFSGRTARPAATRLPASTPVPTVSRSAR